MDLFANTEELGGFTNIQKLHFLLLLRNRKSWQCWAPKPSWPDPQLVMDCTPFPVLLHQIRLIACKPALGVFQHQDNLETQLGKE